MKNMNYCVKGCGKEQAIKTLQARTLDQLRFEKQFHSGEIIAFLHEIAEKTQAADETQRRAMRDSGALKDDPDDIPIWVFKVKEIAE